MGWTDTGAKGAAAELIAGAHFLRQGYYVYRSEGQHAPFDLVIYKDGVCTRVEVKSVGVMINSSTGARACSFQMPRNDQYDLLAVVIETEVLIFERGTEIKECRAAVQKIVAGMPEQDHWGRDDRAFREGRHSGNHLKPTVEII